MKTQKIFLILILFIITSLQAQEERYSVKNIASNSMYSDFGVSFYNENTAVFASSRKDKSILNRVWVNNKQPFLGLYKGEVGENGEINNIELFSNKLNTKFHESSVAFTKDLKTVYFSRNNYLNKKLKKDSEGMVLIQLYRAEVGVDGEWTNVKPMPFNNNNYHTGHPVLNDAENKLYFISDMPGSIGMTDIYFVAINSDGTYGEPVNLGPLVNTSNKEMFPNIDANNILYFSSDGYVDGKGGLDVYAAKIEGDEVYEKAQNLGEPINGVKDDFGLVYQNGQKSGYFSSNRDGGKGDDDIYYFNELKPIKFTCNQIVEGVVKDKESGDLLAGSVVVLYSEDGTEINKVTTNEDASFAFDVDCESKYKIIASTEGYKDINEEFTTSEKRNLKIPLELNLLQKEFVKVKEQIMVNINPIYFDLDKSTIRYDAALELKKVIVTMIKYPKLKIELGSHTDSRAPDGYNLMLSERRAKSTLDYITSRGIDASRISGKGYGETKLVNKCSNGVKCKEAEHQLNRRTEFVILNPEVIK